MRSLTIVLPQKASFPDEWVPTFARYLQSVNGADFTCVLPGNMEHSISDDFPILNAGGGTVLSLTENRVEQLLKIKIKQIRYSKSDTLTSVISSQSQFSDLILTDKATFRSEYEGLSDITMMCPILVPGSELPFTRLVVLMDGASIRLFLKMESLFRNDPEVILLHCPNCSDFEEDKGLVNYTQSHFRKVSVIHLNMMANTFPIQAVADQKSLLIADLGKYTQFRILLEQLFVAPELNSLSYLLHF